MGRPKPSGISPCRRALSLVEIVIVVMILGILAATAAISFHNATSAANLQRAADRVAADMYLVKSQAARDRREYILNFNSSTLDYIAPAVMDPITREPLSVALSSYGIDTMTTLGWDAEEEVKIDENGYPIASGTVTLTCGGRTKTITMGQEGAIEQSN